jgi:peptidoglycan/LPS O-acetylase OafA/YrhL
LSSTRFPGLDTLRFFAASFVVLDHIPLTQGAVGLPNPSWGAFFFRGAPAVKLFFTLSGFLITYLLMAELDAKATVDVRRFYLRRVCRIWPLYFLVVGFGLVFYRLVLPWAGIHYRIDYDWRLAAVLYLAFLPNLMNSLYSVGGILNPLWSIGIEEQFYLTWAPLVRRFRRHLPRLFTAVLVVSFALFLAAAAGLFGHGIWKKFVDQLEFHYMAAGGLAAWAWRRHPDRLLGALPFRSRAVQAVLLLLLVEYYFVGRIPWHETGEELLQLVLYPWLLLNVAVNPRSLIHIGSGRFSAWPERLGGISYGIYMLHMPVVYAVSQLFRATHWWQGRPVIYTLVFYLLVCAGTVIVAAASFRWFETPFLRLKDRAFAAPSPPTPPILPGAPAAPQAAA